MIIDQNLKIKWAMQITTSQRAKSYSIKTRRQSLQNINGQEQEFFAKNYRCLLSVYYDNINSFIKIHRDVLGEMDNPIKIKNTKQEIINIQENLSIIYFKEQERLSKDCQNRNTETRKTYQEYINYWKGSNGEKNVKTCYGAVWKNINQSILSSRKNIIKNSFTNGLAAYRSKTTSETVRQISKNIYNFSKPNSIQLKINNISAHATAGSNQKINGFFVGNEKIIKEDLQKLRNNLFLKNKFEKQKKQLNFQFESSQILIDDKRKNRNQQDFLPFNSYESRLSKHISKRNMNKRNRHNEMIDLELIHNQNKVLVSNSVIFVPQIYNYRPKSTLEAYNC